MDYINAIVARLWALLPGFSLSFRVSKDELDDALAVINETKAKLGVAQEKLLAEEIDLAEQSNAAYEQSVKLSDEAFKCEFRRRKAAQINDNLSKLLAE